MSTEKTEMNLAKVIRSLIREELQKQVNGEETDLNRSDTRAGLPWTKPEEQRLIREFEVAISLIAISHKRSFDGIRSRLEDLYKKGQLCVVHDNCEYGG